MKKKERKQEALDFERIHVGQIVNDSKENRQ